MGRPNMSKVSDESSMSEYTNIFISRMLIYTGVCFAFIYGLSQFHINLASGFYFFPFVMVLLILEHICKAYNISSKRFLIMPVLLLLLVYYLGYSVVFLTLTIRIRCIAQSISQNIQCKNGYYHSQSW